MTPSSSPQKKPVSIPNDEYPWPISDNPLRKDAMVPKKLFDKAMEEKAPFAKTKKPYGNIKALKGMIDGDKLEDADLRERMVSVRRNAGPRDDTKK